MKILYFDTETTGLDENVHDIIQIAGVIEIDGEIKEKFNYKIKPFNMSEVSYEALETNGFTLDAINKFDAPDEVLRKLIVLMGQYVDRFDPADKFYPAGYNVQFDLNFLRAFFEKNNDKFFGSWFYWRPIDPLPVLYLFETLGKIHLPNYKLTTVCELLGIEFKAHDAFEDIEATMKVIDYVRENIK